MRRPKLARDTVWLASSNFLAIIFGHFLVICSSIESILGAVPENISVKGPLLELTN